MRRLVRARPLVDVQLLSRRWLTSDVTDAATRLTNPSVAFPATGAPGANPTAATVVWREHWDLLERKPYYHNLITNETSWDMPNGFPTRFEPYYARLKEEHEKVGIATVEHLRAARVAEANGIQSPKRSLSERLVEYGPAGFTLYSIIHFVGFVIAYALIWYGVDLAAVARRLGIDVPPASNSTKGATFVAAVAVNKVMVPAQILLTLALAPRLTPAMKYAWKRFVFFNQ